MKRYPLTIDPRILELLGPNLYTNIYYVLAELIANAYDADASNVYITSSENEIRVEDDGKGMSYEGGDINGYLNVAAVSRTTAEESKTDKGRLKMGRKGVGKLAALSVSHEVDVMTTSNGEVSGFVLSRTPPESKELVAIPDDEISFEHLEDHGTAIVMRDPQYRLHATLPAVKRNLIKMFPLVNQGFRIHVKLGNKSTTISSFDDEVMKELGALITLGEDFERLGKLVPNRHPKRRADLVSAREAHSIRVSMPNSEGRMGEYDLEVRGWIGTYVSTKGRKAETTDFPDNFISLIANGKVGEFNILPVVGQNKLSEVYVVGQLHVDLFERTDLPDMALSNRQGYKSDDPRHVAVLKFVRDDLLFEMRRRRDLFSSLEKATKQARKLDEQKQNEEKLRDAVTRFRRKTSDSVARAVRSMDVEVPEDDLRLAIDSSLNEHSAELGIKAVVDTQKKKVLISHTGKDKALADVIYEMLLHNGVPPADVLYTNCDDEVCRIPEGTDVFDYLREFFVESYSTQRIMVLFVTSDNMNQSWGALSEVGASWITKIDHKIFNIHPFRPQKPLNDAAAWHTTNRDGQDLWMDGVNADELCRKIEAACDALDYSKSARDVNRARLEQLVAVRA